MKTLIIILLSLSTTLSAQWYNSEAFKSIAINSSIVALEAVGDGLLDQGKQDGNRQMMMVGHSMQAGSIALAISKPLLQDLTRGQWILDILTYGFIRVGTFNLEYNLTRGLPAGYIGTTSLYDKFLSELRQPDSWTLAGQSLMLIVGLSIPINYY